MKLSALVGERFKEKPADATIESHALMVRGGYMKIVASGIFSELPPLKRITSKIHRILREEMDAVDGQEVMFPVTMPAALWEESGRYQAIGSELARWQDRSKTPMVLGMTHEEACVHMVREYGSTYQRYPFMVYQIQTKFRDEPRARAGLIRAREFTMKDGYSFHTSQEDLEAYYRRVHKAYERIFARAGLPQVVSVLSDSGMMGGKIAHEFMLLTAIGEDSIVLCPHCGYRANMEAAPNKVNNLETGTEETRIEELKLVDTPNAHTIDDIRELFNVGAEHCCKAVVYEKYKTGELVVVFMRGDLEANETKIRNFVGEEIAPATLDADSAVVAGFIGPMGLPSSVTTLYDNSLIGLNSLICGANVKDKHYYGVNLLRDIGAVEYHDFTKTIDGGICPDCGKEGLTVSQGVEVGNIFQLGTKYSESMGMRYTDENGEQQTPTMGCYGIGVGRLAASVCEVLRDDKGPIWPISIAPWEVHLCALRSDDEAVRSATDKLYAELQSAGLEVIYDDRLVAAGFMFSDADLLGVPIRVVVSPRNLGEGIVELATRDKSVSEKVPLAEALDAVKQLRAKLYAAIDERVPK